MFKALRPLLLFRQTPIRSLSSPHHLFRTPCRPYLGHNGPLKIQQVRIRRPLRFTRSVISSLQPFAYIGLTYLLASWLLSDDGDEDEEEVLGVLEKGIGKDGEEEDTIFIPLGFPYELPPSHYKGQDPEWQSFVALSRDKKLCQLLRNDLAGHVGRVIGSHPSFQNHLGEGNRPQRFWLDIDFPQGPPPEYERKGIEISDDHITWTTRPVHPLHYSMLQQALLPVSLASSVWASQKAFALTQYSKVKTKVHNVLRLPSDSTATEPETCDSPELESQIIPSQRGSQKQKSAPDAGSGMPSGSSAFSQEPNQSLTKNRSWDRPKIFPITPTIPDLSDDTVSATKAFKTTFAQTWRPASAPPERGTVLFSGLVEISGPKGTAVLDVRAAYHPEDKQWCQIAVGVRRFRPRKQGPRGGS